MSEMEIKTRAREIIDEAVNCVLVTVDHAGFPHPRTMWTAGVDDDFTVYFATGRGTMKCAQLAVNPKVCMFWTQTDDGRIGWSYAFIKGEASISDDQALRDRFWNDELRPYFPSGSTDPNYVILVVKPTELMLMDGHKYPLDRVEF